MVCIDAEILKQPAVPAAIPLVAEHHTLETGAASISLRSNLVKVSQSATHSFTLLLSCNLAPLKRKLAVSYDGPKRPK